MLLPLTRVRFLVLLVATICIVVASCAPPPQTDERLRPTSDNPGGRSVGPDNLAAVLDISAGATGPVATPGPALRLPAVSRVRGLAAPIDPLLANPPTPAPTALPSPVPARPSKPAPTPTTVLTPLPAVPAAPAAQVFLDPGHGGIDTGAIGTTEDGSNVAEKDLALALALRTASHLRADGISVVLSRNDDSLPDAQPADYSSDGTQLTPDGVLADLQRRINRANASQARVMLSIHFNGFADPAIAGTQTFYDGSRPFADRSARFATLIQETMMNALHARGYTTPDRGITDDQELQGDSLGSRSGNYNHLILLGPAIPGILRPSNLPSALIETLFLTNPPEATVALQTDFQEVLATSFTQAIEEYLKTGGQ
jgi:N-acetylmuramoyl-L-alanine amidase